MALLGHNSYLPVSAIKKDYRFLCLDETQKELILQNLSFIAKLELLGGYPADRYYKYFEVINEPFKSYLGPLENIFLNAVIDARDFVHNKETFYEFYKDKIICAAEIFKGDDERSNYGAGRNIILKDLELKGCGRNNSASRLDYNHAWGGMYLLEAIYEFLISNVLNYSTLLGAERSIAIGTSNEAEVLKHDTPAVLLRQRSSPRVSMSNKTFEGQTSMTYLKTFFSKKHYLEEQILHYLTMNFNGFFHKSMTLENATLNGKVLDCNSIALAPKRNGILGSIIINPQQELKAETIPDLLKAHKLVIENNTLKNLFQVLHSVTLSYQKNINKENKNIDVNLMLRKTLEQFGPHNDAKSISDLINGISTLPLCLENDLTPLANILSNKHLKILKFKKIQRSTDWVFMIEFHIPIAFDLPNLLVEFNSTRQSTFEPFMLNLIKALPFLPKNPHTLTDLLFREVLNMVQISPFSINSKGKVIVTQNPLGELSNQLINLYNAKSYLCFYNEAGSFVQNWHTLESVINLNQECIVCGIKSGKTIRPIAPLYFAV